MITAIVFVKADVARIPEVAEAIASLEGISEVYSVTGQIDLIALVRVRHHEDVATVVADQVNKVEGVTETETHIAFRTYSRHDLESVFSIALSVLGSRVNDDRGVPFTVLLRGEGPVLPGITSLD